MIQIRNVPDPIHRTLKARAAQAGMSLSAYLLRQIAALAEQPTLEEIFERIRRHGPALEAEDSASIIREMRGPLPHQEAEAARQASVGRGSAGRATAKREAGPRQRGKARK